MLRAGFLRQHEFVSRNLDRKRHEILGLVELEVIQLHRNGELGDGIAEHQGFFELPLLIRGGEFAELFVGIISLTIGQVRRSVLQRNLDAAQTPVAIRVRGVIAEDVVTGIRLLGPDNAE